MAQIPVPENFDVAATQQQVLSQKGVALRAIAAGGTEALQMAMANQAAQAQMAGGAAMQAAANAGAVGGAGAASGFAAEEAQRAGASFAPLQAAAQMQGAAGQAFTGLLSQANENYGQQVSQAVPLVQQQTQRELNSLHSRAKEASADREQARALANLQLQSAREDRAARAADRAAGKELDTIQLERAKIGLESDKVSLARQLASDANGGLTDNDMRSIKALADKTQANYGKSFAVTLAELSNSKFDDKGRIIPSQGYKAVKAMIDEGLTAEQAARRYPTPGGKPLSREAIQDWYNQYRAGLRRELETVPGYLDMEEAARRRAARASSAGGYSSEDR